MVVQTGDDVTRRRKNPLAPTEQSGYLAQLRKFRFLIYEDNCK